VRREKCPDRGRAKRVAALRVRVDHAKSCSHPDRTTLSASNVAVTRVRKQSHQAHFSGENDWKLGKSGQKKIGTKIIGPKFAENRCRLCRKLQKRNEIATGKANAAADADSEIEDRPRARPERARRVLLILNEAGIAFRTTIRISICVRTKYEITNLKMVGQLYLSSYPEEDRFHFRFKRSVFLFDFVFIKWGKSIFSLG
jgi:hypothetical protein